MSEERTCPVPECKNKLGETKQGDPWLLCRKHWYRVPRELQFSLWRAYRAWQRIERNYLAILPDLRPPALLSARAVSIQHFIDVRTDCVRKASDGESHQLEVAL